MTISLRIENLQADTTVDLPKGGWVETDRDLRIGRTEENDLVLDDGSGTISKHHCTISRAASGYTLTDHSRNGTFLNSAAQPLQREAPVVLKPGDFIQISYFGLTVVEATAEDERMNVPVAETPADQNLFGRFEEPTRPPRSVSRAFREVPVPSFDTPSELDIESLSEPERDPIDALLDDSPPPASLAGPFSKMPDRAHDRGAPNPSYSDHLPVPQMAFVQPRLHAEPIPDDWDIVSDIGLPATAAPDPLPDPIPASAPAPRMAAPMQPVSMQAAPMQPVSMQAAPVSPFVAVAPPGAESTSSEDRRAIEAFLEGCGITAEECRRADMVTVMGRAGRALRLSIANLHEILSARTSAKEGLGVERTMLGRSGNNPLKFVADPHDALMAVLIATIPGFLVADEAVEQGFTDVKNHEISMVTAMQAALSKLCQQLAPKTVERAAAPPSLAERLKIQPRSARYWQSYCAAYDQVTAELDNNGRQMFGADFARAYRHGGGSDRSDADVG